MKYFRDSTLAFWSLVVVALGLLTAVGVHLGNENGRTLVVQEARLEDERPAAAAMLTRVSQIKAVAESPATDLNEWGAETATYAMENAKRRASAAGSEDPIALAYAAIAMDAEAMSVVDETDANAVLTLQARIGVNYDRLSAAASGISVPGLTDAPVSVTPGGDNSTATDVIIKTKEETP